LTTQFGTAAEPTGSLLDVPIRPKKHGWLPLLTVLFLISYGLMTMLIVEQGATIESQRALIHELFRDSTELSAVRMKAQQNRGQASTSPTQSPVTQNPSSQNPSTQIPATKAPSTQAPTKQVPSAQAGPQHRTQKSEKEKQFQMPSRPASDLVDDTRTLITI